MNAAEIRNALVSGGVLACSEVRFVGPDGRQWVVADQVVTGKVEDGKLAGTPAVVFRLVEVVGEA